MTSYLSDLGKRYARQLGCFESTSFRTPPTCSFQLTMQYGRWIGKVTQQIHWKSYQLGFKTETKQ